MSCGVLMNISKSKFIVIFTMALTFAHYKPSVAFNGSGYGNHNDFYKDVNNYIAYQYFNPGSQDRQTLARLGRTRFVNRSFGQKMNKRPNFNQRLQKKLSKKFRDIRSHKSRNSSGRRIRRNKLVRRKSLLTDGRRAFQNTLRHRLQNRPQSGFRRRLHNRFQGQNNGPLIRRSDARRHR